MFGTGQIRVERVRERRLPDLPRYYYLSNFEELLGFVEARYSHCFDRATQAFLEDFRALPHPAQCLYVRLASRKGVVFTSDKLAYEEISDIGEQIERLRAAGFACGVDGETFADWLNHLSKPELVEMMRAHLPKDYFKASMKKGDLVGIARDWLDPAVTVCPTDRRFVVQGKRAALRYLMYLYFGRIEESLTPFVMRDLGLMRRNRFRSDFEARFDRIEDARASFFYADALRVFGAGETSSVQTLIDMVESWPKAECDEAATARDRLLRKIGGLSEKRGDTATALAFYEQSNTPRCNERAVRLRWAAGDKTRVRARLDAMINDPASEGELDFAQDFYARKFGKRRTSAMTDMLRAGTRVVIDEAYRGSPERAMKQRLETQGFEVRWTENRLWKMLFGLLFWDEIYDPSAAIHNAFERRPRSLSDGTFYTRFEERIEAKLARLNAPERMVGLMKTVSAQHRELNGIFQWHGRTLDAVRALMSCENAGAVAGVLRAMARDYRRTRDGFPDLMLIREGRASFAEVKAEGDQLRRNQLTRIRQMRDAGLEVGIYRVAWEVDPDQTYVVVDVETTGGRPPHHRVTEVGAVKIRGGEVIDTFQSLINPERHIPATITRITGISNAMVADAPRFAEIADAFAEFMGESIFCAHNVNFDYGFIAAEYRRLERWFRYPKLCTCAKMRQLYPGYRSYSLKNLCREFEIPLESHHRALCDAKAAGELLKLVNARRTGPRADAAA